MKTLLQYLLKLLLFWLAIFFLNRIIFYCAVISLLNGIPFILILRSFYHGLRLDLSMIGYFTAIPLLLFFFYFIIRKKMILYTIDGLNYLFIILYNLTAFGEVCLYREWKAKLNMQALAHFTNPSEVFRSASLGLTVLFFSLTIIFTFLYIKFYNRKISFQRFPLLISEPVVTILWKSVAFLLSILAFSILSIRGGLQAIPIESSDSYFCDQPIVNDAAVNPFWNLAYNMMDYQKHFKENPYKDFTQAEADSITRSLYKVDKDSTVFFLNTKRPNIVFILLESWSAYCVKSFGGDDFAPFLDSLSKQGIWFTKFYPAGYTSDQGIPAVLSGYPSVSHISIISQSTKSVLLPCIDQDLKKYGYQSGFIFGGDLNYGNLRSYIFNKKFDVVKEERDIDSDLPRGKLGIQDEYMAEEYVKTINNAKQPFVYTWFTLSSHMPYDFPGEKKQLVKTENEYVNSVTYTDKALRKFFSMAKKQSWYSNTLFVVVADHSHAGHKEFSTYDAEYHRIPMVFFGDVIKPEYKGKEIKEVHSQLDITPTLLKQMELNEEAKQYVWSNNMFDPYSRSFAFYCIYDGAGFITNKGFVGYQHNLKELIFNTTGKDTALADSLTKYGKAFQQAVYEDYRLK